MYEFWWRFSRLQNNPLFFCLGQEHGKGQTKSWGEGENKVWDWGSRDNPQKSEKQLIEIKRKYMYTERRGVLGYRALRGPCSSKDKQLHELRCMLLISSCKMAEFITVNQTVLLRRLRRIYSIFTMPTNLMEMSKWRHLDNFHDYF